MKAEWRSALTMSGVLCVMTSGEVLMLLLCVNNWDILLKVISDICKTHTLLTNLLLSQ